MNKDIKDVDEEWVDFSNEYHMGEDRFYKYFIKEEIENMIQQVGYNILKIKDIMYILQVRDLLIKTHLF